MCTKRNLISIKWHYAITRWLQITQLATSTKFRTWNAVAEIFTKYWLLVFMSKMKSYFFYEQLNLHLFLILNYPAKSLLEPSDPYGTSLDEFPHSHVSVLLSIRAIVKSIKRHYAITKLQIAQLATSGGISRIVCFHWFRLNQKLLAVNIFAILLTKTCHPWFSA